jgi:hypothetical protein
LRCNASNSTTSAPNSAAPRPSASSSQPSPRPDPGTSDFADPISTNFVTVTNTSPQPIYNLRFLFRESDGEWTLPDDPPDPAPILMPGERYEYPFSIDLPYVNYLLDPSLVAAGVVFRDASGVDWRLYSDGRLDEEAVAD